MANNEDVNQADQVAPAADIPDLKKKEKERKKAGAGWGGVKPGGGSFSGAAGGAGARAAASVASSMGGAAAGAAEAAGASWLSSMIASLTATVLGKAILAAGVAMFVAGAGLFAYVMLNGGTSGPGGVGDLGDLGEISSSMKIRGDGGDRTGYIVSNGEIMFDPLKKAEAKKELEKAPEEKTAEAPVPPEQIADTAGGGSNFNRPGLEYNMSGSKLSSSLGGGFGGKNIFAGSGVAPKFNESLAKTNIHGGEKGRLSASRVARTGRSVAGRKSQGFKSNKAFGQLRVAKGMSAMGAGMSGAEGARQTAAGAFDGTNSGAGNVVGGPTAPTGIVDSPSGVGGGAPDVTAPSVTDPCVDPSGGPNRCVGVDPNTFDALNGIAAMAKKAGEMKRKAAQLMMMGIIMIALGAALMGTMFGAVIGAILIGLGGMLIGMSMMMSQMAAMMKGLADSMSQSLAARTSDVKQNEINRYCIDKAYNEGTDPKNCNPPDSVTENKQTIESDDKAVKEHKDMVKDTSRVEEINDQPASP